MRYHSPQFFSPKEYLPPALYSKLGDSGIIVMDARILWTADALRKKLGPTIINTWSKDKRGFEDRGFRLKPVGAAQFSQHMYGRALDMTFERVTVDEVRSLAADHKLDYELQYITRIESGVPWLHVDCASIPGNDIVFFSK